MTLGFELLALNFQVVSKLYGSIRYTVYCYTNTVISYSYSYSYSYKL